MEVPSSLVGIVLIATSSVAWWGVLTAVPRASRSRFRAELWKLRDEVVDKFVLPEASPRQDVFDLVDAAYFCISRSESFTAFRIASLHAFWRGAGHPSPELSLKLLPQGNDDPLDPYRERLVAICDRYSPYNSFFGWPVRLLYLFVMSKFSSAARVRNGSRSRIPAASDIGRRSVDIDLQTEVSAAHRSPDHLKSLVGV